MKVINKSIRLIELFSGYGSQYMALKTLAKEFDVPICSYKTCEWEASAIRSYKVLHFPNDNTNYSDGLSKEELIDALYSLGVSNDGGKNPMTYRAIKIKMEDGYEKCHQCRKFGTSECPTSSECLKFDDRPHFEPKEKKKFTISKGDKLSFLLLLIYILVVFVSILTD